jgi:hypothetical protein
MRLRDGHLIRANCGAPASRAVGASSRFTKSGAQLVQERRTIQRIHLLPHRLDKISYACNLLIVDLFCLFRVKHQLESLLLEVHDCILPKHHSSKHFNTHVPIFFGKRLFEDGDQVVGDEVEVNCAFHGVYLSAGHFV